MQERDVINGEFQREALQEGQYSRAYQSVDQETVEAKQLRSTIVSGGLTHLQEQYVHLRQSEFGSLLTSTVDS